MDQTDQSDKQPDHNPPDSHLEQLYTPWRMSYLRRDKDAASNQPVVDCVFCAKVTADDAAEQVVARSTFVLVTLNRYPYNNGHLLVVPYAHVPSLENLPTEALTDLMITTNQALSVLRQVYNPHAFNIGANLGEAAGAGIAGHFHLHIVPRWAGDTNYMTITANTRVIPDVLDDTWRKLREIWPQP